MVTDFENFKDIANIEHIRENLYKGTEYGRAAVMIGAGFSRNAEKFSPNVPDFPLAHDIGRILYLKLYPESYLFPDEPAEEIDFGSCFDKYASEYCKKFGKGELYNLLIKSIPDEKYLPGEVHELLLSLRWSDIFTTNYDTLLERTLPKIYSKKYDIIKTDSQIPIKSKPRIVKLHGDIPSHSFIITEEDYAHYKEEHGAFQNLVQESILENIFCLIGFGGKDKNFKKWTEWVRQNLGNHSPPIYLCGVLDLDDIQRNDFENEKIKIVDLGPLFPPEKFTDNLVRNKTAVEWFLKSLQIAKPEDQLNWPMQSQKKEIKLRHPMAPPILPVSSKLPLFEEAKHFIALKDKSMVENIRKIWTIERQTYPGWLIAPKNSRDAVLRDTIDAIDPIFKYLGEFEFPLNLELIYELNWRLEVCLSLLFSNVADNMESLIKTINPFPELFNIEDSSISPDIDAYKNFNWAVISTQWIALAYSLARQARESNNIDRYHFWIHLLEKLNVLDSNLKNAWYYEKCMFSLFQLDQEGLKKYLTEWSIDDHRPEYYLKKAGLYSELGEFEKANTFAEQALTTIRLHIHSNREDIYLLSLEGWCMLILQVIESIIAFGKRMSGDYRERWEQLARYHCDPRLEIEKFNASVSVPQPRRILEIEKKPGFDIGNSTFTHHFMSKPEILRDLPAFEFLKMHENVGLPMIFGHITLTGKEINYASNWIEKYDPLWSFIVKIRAGKKEEIENRFGRSSILSADDDLIHKYYNLSINSLKQSLNDYIRNGQSKTFDHSFSYRQIEILMEFLSRISIRLSEEKLIELFNITLEIYKSQKCTSKMPFYKGIRALLQRVCKSLPPLFFLERMPFLLSLPIPGINDFNIIASEHFPEPFEYIQFKDGFKLPSELDRTSWQNLILNMIQIAQNESPDVRKRALLRLITLFEIHALTAPEIEAFKKSLWDTIDPKTQLPGKTNLLNFVFLRLPEPEKGYVEKHYRKWLIAVPIPQVIQRTTDNEGKVHHKSRNESITRLKLYVYEWLYSTHYLTFKSSEEPDASIEWSEDEIIILFNNIENIWNEQKTWLSEFKENNLHFYQYQLDMFEEILFLFEQVVLLQSYKIKKSQDIERIINCINDFEYYGFCVNSGIPGIIPARMEEFNRICDKISLGFLSSDENTAEKSFDGLYNLALLAFNKKINPLDKKFISDFVNCILFRKEPGLSHALHIASELMYKYPELFSEKNIADLLISLQNLHYVSKIKEKKIELSFQEESYLISDSEKVAIQSNARKLAKNMYPLFMKPEKEIPEILTKY